MFGKKKHLRKSILEESELMKETRALLESEHISPKKREALEEKWKHITEHLNKIAPAEPLTQKQVFARVSLVSSFLFLLLVPAGIYVKMKYYTKQVTSSQGETQVGANYRYVPEEIAEISQIPEVTGLNTSEDIDLARFEDLDGTVVGVFSKKQRMEVYYTRRDGEGFSLYRRTADTNLHNVSAEKKVFAPGFLVDASIVLEEDRFVLAYAAITEKRERLFVQTFDAEWKATREPMILEQLTPKEQGNGLSLIQIPKKEGEETQSFTYALLTTNDFGTDASVQNKTSPILRTFDAQLNKIQEKILNTDKLTLDTHMAFVFRADGGLHVISNGRDPLAPSEQKKGDELYQLDYDKEWELEKMFRLTNNGLPHDFWPSEVFLDRGLLFFPFHRIQHLPQFEGDDSGYPKDAGKVFLMAVRNGKMISGSVFAHDYDARPQGGEKKIGGRNTHVTKVGKKLFVVHDAIIENDVFDTGDGAYRLIRAKWIDLMY